MNRADFKIGVYVLAKNAKAAYKKECYDVRMNAGMEVVCDILRRAGFTNISYCSGATAHRYDVVMFSVTGDCDFWPFVAERVRWEKSRTKVVVGGSAVLNPRPFLGLIDYFVLGRAEGVQDRLMQAIMDGEAFDDPHVVSAASFSMDRLYYINQAQCPYPHEIRLPNGKTYREGDVGCSHKCLFCNYTWTRKHTSAGEFRYGDLWTKNRDVEMAIVDMERGAEVDMNRLRTTAIDGSSERLRFRVNKRITRAMLRDFLRRLAHCQKPHMVRIYNIVGYPTETPDDWAEFAEDCAAADADFHAAAEKQTGLVLHNTPFRPMPATPLACEPMAYRNFRGLWARTVGAGRYKGNIFLKGNGMWAVEGMGCDSLPAVIQSAVIWRGTEKDQDNVVRIAQSRAFQSAPGRKKQATLEKYFDVGRLFGAFSADTLPTRNIRTYCHPERMWPREKDGLEAENQGRVQGRRDVPGTV